MATFSGQIRQGLPRTPGGEPWPAAGVAAQSEAATQSLAEAPAPDPVQAHATPGAAQTAVHAPAPEAVAAVETVATAEPVAASEASAAGGVTLRRGLPRVPGGEPWPPAGAVAGAAVGSAAAGSDSATASKASASQPAATVVPGSAAVPAAQSAAQQTTKPAAAQTAQPAAAAETAAPQAATAEAARDAEIRRGLPRVAGGAPWPENGFVPAWAVKSVAEVTETVPEQTAVADPQPTAQETPVAVKQTHAAEPTIESPAAKATLPATTPDSAPPAEAPAAKAPTATPAAQPAKKPKTPREPIMIGERTLQQVVKMGVLLALGAIAAAGIIVLAARGVTTLPGVPDFLKRYPGEYAPAVQADPGFPAWARWSHFFNFFLMVLIIRSGLHVRTQQKPPAFWTPKKGGKKISINLWLHTSLDLLWMLNGAIFVVLLFVSGHWARIVPTSWEVFPNAASALLQYMTLDWPTDDGWVNYNSLQQIMYFLVVFVAAPIAIITGLRMSEWWPEKADRLNKIYPAPLARALHFPTMLFFVLFILVHVFLVFSTGALKNLNHMFAGTTELNWVGFWLFALAIAVTVAGWLAARPLVLAPIANLFGRVSNR